MSQPDEVAGRVAPPAALADETRAWGAPLVEAAGSGFVALYLYGSALGAGFDPQASDVNVLLVVRELEFESLRSLARALAAPRGKAAASHRFTPLVLTESQIASSADVFPVEFLDLTRRRALLLGEDVLANVRVGRANLRHQIEFELRSKLLGLRQAYLLSGAAPGAAAKLLAQAAGGSAAVLRHLLTLRGESPPDEPGALVTAVSHAYALDAGALEAPFAVRREPLANDEEAASRLASYLRSLEALIAAVDALHDA